MQLIPLIKALSMSIVVIRKGLNKIPALVLGVLTYLILVENVWAQYRFDMWTTDNGLPQNNVNNILQTSDGFLWMTTFDGLVRYDGVRFKVFNGGNTRGIKSSRFLRLFEDRDKNLWVATEESGITRYKDGVFTTYTTVDGLPHNRISRELQLREDEEGVVINTDGGPVRWKNGQFVPYNPDEGNRFAAIGFPSGPGVIWYIDAAGLHRVENSQVTAHAPSRWPSAAPIRRIYETRDGTLWITAISPKQEMWRLQDGNYTLMTGKGGLPDKWITSVCEDRNGNLWFGTSGAGLYRFRDGNFTVFTTADGLSSNHTNAIYEDREGNIWLGTQKGLCRLRESIITTYSQKDGLAANNVYPIYQDRNGAIWIGSWRGISRYHNGTFTDYGATFGLKNENITTIYEDREGNLWIGAWGTGGVRRIRDGNVSVYKEQENFLNSPVHAICQDRTGALWFGTHNCLIKFSDGGFTKYSKKDGLAGEIVYVMLEDHSGTLWLGTESGLTALRDGQFRTYTAADGLSGSIIRSLYEDAEGVLWIGTYDGGLNRFRDGRFTAYTNRTGLFNNGVFQILEDAHGDFWMSCNLGIYRVSKKELNDFAEGRAKAITSVPYGKRDGMLNQECNGGNQPAGIKAADGRLWFPTLEGVVVINPTTIPTELQPPPVIIDEVTIDNESAHASEVVRIEPGKVTFEISYTGLSFINPEQLKFRYRLEGLDSDWFEAGSRRTAYYSHLPPGNYLFRVIAANREGLWNEQGAKIRIVVVPPFWRTWWFTLLAASLLVAVAGLLYTRRISTLLRAHHMQQAFSKQLIESQEAERKRIAAELHDSLGQNLLVIKNRVMLAMRTAGVNDDTLEQLDEVCAATDQAIDEVSEISYNLRPYQLDRLGLSKAIDAMLQRVSGSSGIHFSSKMDAIDKLFESDVETSIYRIVQESVNNIVKHSEATRASVTLSIQGREMKIEIRDNGRGIRREVPSPNNSRRNGGFGLIGMAERTRMLGGHHTIQSTPEAGTTIAIHLNLPDSKNEK
jgi:ligand-binding sensor domain-containing protein/signal transduction histidine kinase